MSERDLPERLGSYRVESRLGRGGMGEVFLAWDGRLERHVAIKRILPDPPPDERARARFLREARAIARLSHPSIVQVFDLLEKQSGDETGADCLVMEYIEGRALSDLVARGPMAVDQAIGIALEVAAGLAEAHAKGLIHRDLKPDNVRIDTAGRAKILDFGLARLLFEGADGGKEATLTQSGALVGTVFAMSPEQASGRQVDHRSDLFALGALLYAMLSGRSPFLGSNMLDTLRRVTSEDPEPLARLRPELPTDLVGLVHDLLAKEPNRRPQNANLVIEALRRLRDAVTGETLDQARPARLARATPLADPSPARPAPQPPAGDSDEMLTGEMPAPSAGARSEKAMRLLVASELVDQARWVEQLGESRAGQWLDRHDQLRRELLERHGGEVAARGLGLFETAADGVAFALSYHRALEQTLSVAELDGGRGPSARSVLHLGEVLLRRSSPEEVASGARPLEVEGAARVIASRLVAVARPRQILLSRSAFDLARGTSGLSEAGEGGLGWLAHGSYLVDGLADPVELFEVGLEGFSPLAEPVDSPLARRQVDFADELVLGWRPARGQSVPRRATWTLVDALGEGPYGEVWLAEHESGEQRVFKFCFEASRLRNLQREVTLLRLLRDALGDRPDIARVLDWNLDAAPYFLELEHTEAGDLASWSGDRLASVPLSQRLELVAQVADALQAAHSVGVLHKNVEPRNVLVGTDAKGRPMAKLTDFGIGLVLDPSKLSGRSVDPAAGDPGAVEGATDEQETLTGSRAYLAPELIEGKPATLQADLYSLGVLLYQVVVGDLARPLATGWRRDIDDALLAADIARLVDGAPERRPGGAGEVAEGLRQLEARRQALAADERRTRRRRLARIVLAAAAVLFVIVALFGWQADQSRVRAEALAERAETARAQAEELIAFMLGDLQGQLRAVGRLDALEGAGEKALDYFQALDLQDHTPATLARWSKALHQMGDLRMAQGDLDAAGALFEESSRRTRQQFDQDPSDEALFELGQSLFWVGNVHWRRGEYEAATPYMEGYLERSQELSDRDPSNTGWLLEVAFGHNNVADVLLARHNPALALEHYRSSLAIAERLVELEPEKTSFRLRVATSHLKIAEVDFEEGQIRPAAQEAEAAAEILETLVAQQPDQSQWLRRLALALDWAAYYRLVLGELPAAEALWRRNREIVQGLLDLDPSHLEWRTLLVGSYWRLGELADYRQQPDEAEAALRRALEIAGPMEPEDDRSCRTRAATHSAFAQHLLARGRLDDARRQAATAVELLENRFEPTDLRALRFFTRSYLTLGDALDASGRSDEATAAWNKARDLLTGRLEEAKGRGTPKDFLLLARVNDRLGRRAEAETHTFALLGMGSRHPRLMECCASFAGDSVLAGTSEPGTQ